ncbi:hypothetical protein OROGR_030196 [Orobanche gracilis]
MNHAQSLYARLSATNDKSPQPVITNDQGDYFITYSIGSSGPAPSIGIFSTGSDLIWTQCQPCKNCTKQTSQIFDSTKSSTYSKISCASDTDCRSRISLSFCDTTKYCQYSTTYGDGTYSDGYLSTETFTLASSTVGGSVSFPKIVFGCGFNNSAQGVVGFGGGKVSFATQMGRGIFSYCLVSLSSNSSSSKLKLGSNAVVSGPGTVSIPLVSDTSRPTFYFVKLEGISVGNQRFGGSGNILIDSGTTMTMLPTDLYNNLVTALKTLDIVPCPKSELLGLSCVRTKTDITNFPNITVHFGGGDVKLKQEHLFARESEDLLVLAIQQAPEGADPIYGSLAQTNFLVGFDLTKKTVSFKPTTCG